MKKLFWGMLILFGLCGSIYGFDFDDIKQDHEARFYFNDTGTLYQLNLADALKYGNFYLKSDFRSETQDFLNDISFNIWKLDFGYVFYENLSIKYQHEQYEIEVNGDSFYGKEGRLGISMSLMDYITKDVSIFNDLTLYFLESQSDNQFYAKTNITYKKFSLENLLQIDIDKNIEDNFYVCRTTSLAYWFRDRYALVLEEQIQEGFEAIWRFGLLINF